MYTNKQIHLSTNRWGIPLRCDLFNERIDQKNFLLWQQLTEIVSCLMVCKMYFCSEFPDIPEKSR